MQGAAAAQPSQRATKMAQLAFLTVPAVLLLLLAGADAAAHEILLDPGHSAQHYGAESCSGGREYRYNNWLTETVAAYLAQRGVHADVTRQPEEEISLMQRAAKSRGKKLLLSVHHDSVQPQFITRVDGRPCSEKARGYAIFVSRKNRHAEQSVRCAAVLGRALRDCGLQPSTHHGEPIPGENREALDAELGIYWFDDLVVLKHARSPALLLEATVIVHPYDDMLAQSDIFQNAIAEAVYRTALFALRE